MRNKYLALILFSIIGFSINSQTLYRMNNIPVYHGAKQLKNPFTGGMNACLINQMDLNNDSKKDLVVLHQVGSNLGRIQTYINKGGVDYIYAPRYEAFFPKTNNYIFHLRDLNEDNLEDLILQTETYFIIQYGKRTNDSTFQFDFYDTIEFESYDTLRGIQPIITMNKYYPVFRDLDWDGDIDIVYIKRGSFSGDERWYYKNYKKELGLPANENKWRSDNKFYGLFSFTLDPLKFKAGEYTPMRGEIPKEPILNPRHDEFQMVWDLDINNDSLYDFCAYSENQRNAPLGLNTGSKDAAYIRHYDTYFPSYSKPINSLMPIGFWYDIDADAKNDILSSFMIERDNTGVSIEDKLYNDDINTISFYKNVGKRKVLDEISQTYHDSFVFITDSFLADETIDVGTGSQPIFYDYDQDSLVDLLVASIIKRDSFETGSIAYYQNIGTRSQPQFKLVSNDVFGYKSKHKANIRMATGDMNGDGKEDLIISSYKAVDWGSFTSTPYVKIDYDIYYQKSSNGLVLFLNDTLTLPYDGQYGRANICIHDVDKDGLQDLFIGDLNYLKYYRNTGTASKPNFGIANCDSVIRNKDLYEFSNAYNYMPSVWKNPTDSLEYLIFAYELYGGKIGKALIDTQKLRTNNPLNIVDKNLYPNYSLNQYPTLQIKDITNDGKSEIVFGNYAGGLQVFSFDSLTGVKDPPPPPSSIISSLLDNQDVLIFPNPASNSLNILLPKQFVNSRMEVYSIEGKNILNMNLSQSKEKVDISQLSNGVYILRISNDKLNSKTLKFIKE